MFSILNFKGRRAPAFLSLGGMILANCGSGDDDVNIVIEHDGSGLSPGQAIRVIGTVEEPVGAMNAMGGMGQYPTVKSIFME